MTVDFENPPPRRSVFKRRALQLLTAALLLYGGIFAGIYLWSSGFDPNAFLDRLWIAEEEETAELLTVGAPQAPHTLPPLDDIALDEEPSPLLEGTRTVGRTGEQPSSAPDITKETPPIVPKQVPVPGVGLGSALTPLKCWDARGFEQDAEECDALADLSRIIESDLTQFEVCRTELAGEQALGRLVLFAEADFVRNRITFWPGTASTLRQAGPIADCLTERYRTPYFNELPHRFVRYRLKGEVRYIRPTLAVASTQETPPDTPAEWTVVTETQTERLEAAAETAREVAVSRERVRVRKAPVDGEIIGFISTPQRVKLLQVTDEWCLVKTRRGNVGWMVCWGLNLSPDGDTDTDKAGRPAAPQNAK